MEERDPHLPMEERDPSFSDFHEQPPPPPPPLLSPPLPPPPHQQQQQQQQNQQQIVPPHYSFPVTTGTGTYIVQVPKTQIYRVPPPENALIVERHLKPDNKKNPRTSFLFWLLLIIGIVAVIIGISLAILYFTTHPNIPAFSVHKVIVQNKNSSHSHKPHPLFFITLRSKNPNERMGIVYQDKGNAKLSYKQEEIAKGTSPSAYQDYGETKNIRFEMKGVTGVVLPHEVLRSMKSHKKGAKVSVNLSLMVNVPVNIKMGFVKTWDMNMGIICNFRVSSLSKNIRVLSQKCDTKL